MNRIRLLVCVTVWLAMSLLATAGDKGGGGSVHVRGYYRANGTYVAPHTRSAPTHHGGGGFVPFVAPLIPPQAQPRKPQLRPDAAVLAAKNAERKAGFSGKGDKARVKKIPSKTKKHPAPKTEYVKGYYKADGTWVAPHTRYIDGIRNSEEPNDSKRFSEAEQREAASAVVLIGPLVNRRPRMTARVNPRSGAAYASGIRSGAIATVVADAGFDESQAEDSSAGEEQDIGQDDSLIGVDCDLREWHNPDGQVLAIGCFRSRVGNAIWIQTDSSHMLKLDFSELHDDDIEFLDKMRKN